MAEKSTSIESLEAWLASKPYWEKFVWKLNLEKEVLTKEDLDQCYVYLSEHLGLVEIASGPRPTISFKNEIGSIGEPAAGAARIESC